MKKYSSGVSLLLLSLLALSFRKVREWLLAAWRWFRDQILSAVFSFLGLVTKQEFEQRLAEQLSAHSLPSTTPRSTRSPQTIERFGVKVTVTGRAWNYLGIADEATVSVEDINDVLHGPFCPKCMYNLAHERMMRNFCNNCGWSWDRNKRHDIALMEIKRLLYKELSAEVRRTGGLRDTDEEQPAHA